MPFSSILGQDKAVNVLQRAIAAGKIAHAYIFEGIEGCGKKTTALALIEHIFCQQGNGCGQCASCRKLSGQNHPDFHLVEPDGAFIKIDQIRQLQRELAYRPAEAPKKACIIDDADRLNQSAANALLKTLEEPPGDALIILLTSNIGGILPTVLSRCQKLRFSTLSQPLIEQHLLDKGRSSETARIAASLAGGSLGKALDMDEDESSDQRKVFLERVAALSLAKINELFVFAEELQSDKEKLADHLQMITVFLRDVMLIHCGSDDVVNADMLPLLRKAASQFTEEGVIERIQYLSTVQQALQRNANARLALETLFMRLAV